MKMNVLRAVRTLGLGLAVAFSFALNAHAGAYVGKWDPPYGDPFNDLGWRGEIKIDAPTDCGATAGFTGIVTCAPGAAVVSYAFVELYLLADPSTTIDTLTFAPPAPASFTVNKLQFTSGDLTGAVTGRSDWIYNADYDVDFALQFSVNGILATPLPGRITVPTDYSGPILIFRDKVCVEEHHKRGDYDHDDECDDYKFAYGANDLKSPDSRPTITFSAVPEPGSLALVLSGALLAGGLYRRQRADRA